MSEALQPPQAPSDAIERYASFLTSEAARWLATKERYQLRPLNPGSREAFESTAQTLIYMASEGPVPQARDEMAIEGTLTIARYQHLVTLKANQARIPFEQAVALMKNPATFNTLALIALLPYPASRAMTHGLGLNAGQNPDATSRRQLTAITTDLSGNLKFYIPRRHGLEAIVYTRPRVIAELEAYESETAPGCPTQRLGHLQTMYDALADISIADPDLLQAALEQDTK